MRQKSSKRISKKNQLLINLQAENRINPSLNLPDKTKKKTEIFIFAPFCRTLKDFMETVKEIPGE